MWTVKDRPHTAEVNADPRTAFLTDLFSQRHKQFFYVGPCHVRANRILEDRPERFSVLAAEALRITLADYYTRRGELDKAAELVDEDVEDPVDSEESHQSLHWNDFGRMVRALNSAYPKVDPLDLSITKLFKMVLKLPGFDDNPDAANEENLEKLQMAWHEIRSG